MRKLASLALAFCLALTGTALFTPQAHAAPTVLKMTCDSPVGMATDKGARLFKKLVEERSNGKYRVDQFLGQSFGSPESVYQSMMMGSIQIVIQTTSQLSSLETALQLFDCPGLFPDVESFEKVLSGKTGEALLAAMSNKKITMHGFTVPLPRVIWTRTPAAGLDELQHRKIRTTSGKMHIAAVKNLGMTPVPMAWSEVFTSLQQGVIDGQDTSIISGVPQHLAEVSPYIVASDYIIFSEVFATSTKWWNKLSDEDKAMFKSCIQDSIAAMRDQHRIDAAKAVDEVKKQGATVVMPSAAERKVWFEKSKDLYKEFKTIKPEWVDMIRAELKALGKI